jgi:hypothetical protein
MAKAEIEVKPIDQLFVIKANAYEASRKRWNNPLEREIFMAGVEYALKKCKHIMNKSNEKVD